MPKHTILFLAANPIGGQQRALDREARAIHAELQSSGHRDSFDFVTRWAVAPLDLLRELRGLRPTVVHFSGLAAVPRALDRRSLSRDAGCAGVTQQRGLHFRDADGRAQFVSSQALQETFGAAGASVQLVVLQGCYCEVQASALLVHVDCVVGTTGLISDDAARSYAIGLYGGLGERWSIAAAHRQGRAAIALQGSSDRDGPQLRARDGVDAEQRVLAADPVDRRGGGASTTLIIDKASLRISDIVPESSLPAPPVIVWRDLPPPSAMDIFRLLDWRVRATPLIGRELDMRRLLEWASSDQAILARFLVGRGGAGKTRLAFEVAERLRAEGWSAGQVFLDRASAIPFTGKGLFFVIDYPEAHREQVTMLLREMARLERTAVPVRILLLTRLPLKEWVSVIDAADAAGLCDTQDLSSLDTAGAALFHAAASRFAMHVQQAPPEVSDAALADWIAQDEIQGLPVFIVAAALHCVMTQTSELGLTGSEVVAALVRREVKRLTRLGHDARCGEQVAARIVGLAAVSDGLSGAALRRLAADHELGLPIDQPVSAVKAMGLWHDNHVPPPAPDIVAAELLFEVLDASADRAPAWLWACLADSAPAQVDGLGRIAYDIATLRGADALVRFASWLADSIDGDPQRATRWRGILERDTPIGVTRLAVSIGKCLLTREHLDQRERASILSSLSQRLCETGDLRGALQHSKEATEIWRRMAEQDLDEFGPDLARSLSTLAMCLRDDDDLSSGVVIAEEAVDIWQALVAAAPELYTPDLARSLRVWAICLAESRKQMQALELSRRTVEIWRALSASNPRLYEPELARALNGLAVDLWHAGEKTASTDTVRQSIALWEKLVDEVPGRYEPELALGLGNLSRNLQELDRTSEASQTIRRAIRIYGRVLAANPARYGLRLASSFEGLSRDLWKTGNAKAAAAALRDAVELKKELAAAEPSRFGLGETTRLGRLSLELSSARDEVDASALLAAIELAENTVCILLVRGDNADNERRFAYVAVKASHLEEFMAAQGAGTFFPGDYGVIIEDGPGEPPPGVREHMAKEYGFDHDAMVDISDADHAHRLARNLKQS